MIECLEALLARPEMILFRAVSGSRAHGTHHAGSDEDIRGIFALPLAAYASLSPPIPQISDERGDTVYYNLRRFLELASEANPTVLELLFSPADCIQYQSPCLTPLFEKRRIFVTARVFDSHIAYAQAQLKKAKGRNKWINRPQLKEPPEKEAFCWVIPRRPASGAMPYRPIPLAQSGIDLAHCHAASLEHAPNLYRLYRYGPEARGVFRNGTLACESIPKQEEEERCIGLLIYNRQAYDMALRDHQHYWAWRNDRNEDRWRAQDAGVLDYDAKNMMHTFRLLYACEHVLDTGEPLVRVAGERLDFLRAIRAGQFGYDDLAARATALLEGLEDRRNGRRLPEKPDARALDELLHDITAAWEREYA